MLNLLLPRLVRTLLTLFVVVLFTFFLARVSGDPAGLMLGLDASAEEIAAFREAQGFNEPLPAQFGRYFSNLLRGDLGMTVTIGTPRPVTDVIGERLPATLQLGLPAFFLSILFGIPLGILAAYRQNTPVDRTVMVLSLAGQSLPSFFVAIVLILIFGVQLGWLPTFGRESFAHYILPTITLMVFPLAFIVRLTRSSMLEILNETYLRTARAKGLDERHVIFTHALRNALIPVVTVVGLQVAGILSGSAIVETVFAWPGIGSLAVESINQRNFPVIQALVLVTAAAFAIANAGVDIAYAFIDPRIRHGA